MEESVKFEMKDGGMREEFDGGALREVTDEVRGRYDLLSPLAMLRLAKVCELGAKKYNDRNWEKGMPVGRCIQSVLRHTFQYLEGKRDEDHLGHAMWNLMAAIHIEEMVDRSLLPENFLDGMGNYINEEH